MNPLHKSMPIIASNRERSPRAKFAGHEPKARRPVKGGAARCRSANLANGLEVSALGLGCMGMSFGYGPPQRQAGDDRAHPRGRRTRRHILRHRRGLRAVHQRGARRRGACAVPRPGGDRHQVRLRHRSEGQSGRASTAGPSTSGGGRGIAEAAEDRPHRSLLPAPRRSRRADRRRGRRGEGPDPRKARSSTSACPRRASQTIRRAHAVQPVTAVQSEYSLWWREPGSGGPADAARSSGSASCPSARSGKGFLTGKIDENTTFDSTDFRNTVPALHARGAQGESGAGRSARRDRRDARRRRRRRSRSPGCWRRSRGSCRSPAPRKLHVWRKTSAPSPSY